MQDKQQHQLYGDNEKMNVPHPDLMSLDSTNPYSDIIEPVIMPKVFVIGDSRGGGGGGEHTDEFDESSDESDEEGELKRIGCELNPKLKSEKPPWYVEVLLIVVTLLSIVFAIFIIILQYDSPGSVIMTINMIIAIILAILSVVSTIVRWTLLCKKGMPVYVIYLLLAVIGYFALMIISTTITIMVFKQASEDFWVLFVSLSVKVQTILVLSFIVFVLLSIAVLLYCILRRGDLITYINKSVELATAETYKKTMIRGKLPSKIRNRIISEAIAVRKKYPNSRPTVIPAVRSDRHKKNARKKKKKRKKRK